MKNVLLVIAYILLFIDIADGKHDEKWGGGGFGGGGMVKRSIR